MHSLEQLSKNLTKFKCPEKPQTGEKTISGLGLLCLREPVTCFVLGQRATSLFLLIICDCYGKLALTGVYSCSCFALYCQTLRLLIFDLTQAV